MNRSNLKLITSNVMLFVLITILIPTRASAAWLKDNNEKWSYAEDNNKDIGWKQIDGKWYEFDNNGIMQSGWLKDNGKWYYLDSNGVMQTGVIELNGTMYLLGNDGALIETVGTTTEDYSNIKSITPEQAKNLILKEDGEHIISILNEEVKNNTNVQFKFDSKITMDQIDKIKSQWLIHEDEKLYSFDIYNDYWEIEHYYVGIESKKVYRTGNQGGMTIYVIKNNTIVQQYPWIG